MPRKINPANDNQTGQIKTLSAIQLNDIDKAVGDQLRRRRRLLGLSQRYISDLAGLGLHQFRQCEYGRNQIGAALLVQFAVILDVPVSFFFERVRGLDTSPPAHRLALETKSRAAAADARDAHKLLMAISAIGCQRTRRATFRLVAAMGQPE